MHTVILSRFNCVQRYASEGVKARMTAKRFNPRWQRKQLDLMQHFTAPAIRSQKDSNFSWYVFVQQGTDEDVKDEIRAMKARIVSVVVDDVAAAQEFIRARRGPVVSINLDTDDSISPFFVSSLRSELVEKNETLVYRHGMRFRLSPPFAINVQDDNNHFRIRVEKNAKVADTVFTPSKVDRVLNISTAMWMQQVHGDSMGETGLNKARKDVDQHRKLSDLFEFTPMAYSPEPGMRKTPYGRYISEKGN